MLLVPGMSRFSFTYNNWGANPSIQPGTSVTPGTSNAEGSWTAIASSANIAQDCYWLYIAVQNGFLTAVAKNHLLDIGVDPAGGSSYTAVISNIVCGESTSMATAGGAHNFIFPIFIKAGSSVAVRIQGSHTVAGTVKIGAKFYGQPSRPETSPVGMFSETIGTITNSNGVSFTPGNAADGTWTSLGTTVRDLWWWQIGYQINNTVITAEETYIDLAYGDGTNFHQILRLMHIGETTEGVTSVFKSNIFHPEAYCPVPAGATMYIRGRCNNAPDTGYNGVAIGVGGLC